MTDDDRETLLRLGGGEIPAKVERLYDCWQETWNHAGTDPLHPQVAALMFAVCEEDKPKVVDRSRKIGKGKKASKALKAIEAEEDAEDKEPALV